MASSSLNRSPSPMMSRHNTNSRTQQEGEGVPGRRKSFTGYPIGNGKLSIVSQARSFNPNTPANSPAEYGKRASFRDHEHKENERDHGNLKPIARPRSPSVSKGSRNFMSPTISAASKVIPSPRRKVLGDRNETIRTSASLSDGKFQFFSTMSNSLEFSNENEPMGESEIPNKNVNEFSQGEGNIELESDLVVLSPDVPVKTDVEINVGLDGMIVSGSSPSPIAPLDSDLSFAPYDPKTNFLSPRPQFLCYKPNPRIESYNHGLSLEDRFASESSSEIESSGETLSENSSQEQEEDSFSFSSSSFEGLSEHSPSFESSPTKTHKRLFTKWKTLAFVLVFMFGFVAFSETYNPSLGSAVFQDEVTAKVYHDFLVVVDLAKVNFDSVFQRVKLWSAQCVDHLSQIIHNWREVNTISPVLFSNLTDWQEGEDYLVGDFKFGSFFEIKDNMEYVVEDFELIPEGFVEEAEVPRGEIQLNTETEEQEVEENSVLPLDNGENSMLEKESFAELQSNPQSEEQELSVEEVEVPKAETQLNTKPEEQEVEENHHISADFQSEVPKAEMQSNSAMEEQELQEVEGNYVLPTLDHGGNSVFEEETKINDDFQIEDNSEGSSNPEIPPQIPTTTEPLVEDDQSCPFNLATEEVKTKSQMVTFATPKNSQLLKTVGLVALLILTVAAAFMYLKPKNTTTVISATEKSMTEKSVAKSVKDPSIYECQPSFSGQVEVENMMSEPCPSEMSSFQKTSSQVKRERKNGTDEAQSQSLERKRESLASSSSEYSMFSSSYGSFTTCSKIPLKKGDEKVVTPVRRSSRLRSQV